MKTLDRSVRRVIPQNGHRPLVVELRPGDEARDLPAMIVFREKGTRLEIALPLGRVFAEAARRHAGLPLMSPRRGGRKD